MSWCHPAAEIAVHEVADLDAIDAIDAKLKALKTELRLSQAHSA
jgi:hypothetical protein